MTDEAVTVSATGLADEHDMIDPNATQAGLRPIFLRPETVCDLLGCGETHLRSLYDLRPVDLAAPGAKKPMPRYLYVEVLACAQRRVALRDGESIP